LGKWLKKTEVQFFYMLISVNKSTYLRIAMGFKKQ
jgi:hypothetical protein